MFLAGVSVCRPDRDHEKGGYTAAVADRWPEKEVFFWVYTDFYKWSLLSQAGKLALLVSTKCNGFGIVDLCHSLSSCDILFPYSSYAYLYTSICMICLLRFSS